MDCDVSLADVTAELLPSAKDSVAGARGEVSVSVPPVIAFPINSVDTPETFIPLYKSVRPRRSTVKTPLVPCPFADVELVTVADTVTDPEYLLATPDVRTAKFVQVTVPPVRK